MRTTVQFVFSCSTHFFLILLLFFLHLRNEQNQQKISILDFMCCLLESSVIIYSVGATLYFSFSFFNLRACSHGPGTVNYPGVMTAPGQASPRVHMMICCLGATLPRANFIAPGQVYRHLITTNLSEFL